MNDDRKKLVWPWIVALLIALPMLYVLSFGPACWFAGRAPANAASKTIFETTYYPILWAACVTRPDDDSLHFAVSRRSKFGMLDRWIDWYATLLRLDNHYATCPYLFPNGQLLWLN
jgi:hypothetical protein